MASGTAVDVTVRGAGIFGLSIAWACVRRGAKVRVIDLLGPGAGSSGGLVGALSPHVPETWNEKKAFQLDSLLMASGWWATVEATSGRPSGYARQGRLQPLPDLKAVEVARHRADNAQHLWQGKADWRVIPARGGPWEPASPSGWLVEDTLSARISPWKAMECLLEAIKANGGDVVTGDATECGRVIHATGVPGLDALSENLGRKIGSGVKGQALSLRYDAPTAPQLCVDGLHIVPHADGTVAIGSTSENTWDDDGPDHRLDGLLAKAVAAVPVLGTAEVLSRWAGIRPRATSRAPLLGAWPGRPGHYVANGGFKIGFGMAPKVAEVMADLVLDGLDTIPAAFGFDALP